MVDPCCEPYFGTAFSLGRCCTRAPDLAAQSRQENKQAVDRLSSPLKYKGVKSKPETM